jgi:2-polyprenyl-3-methyl-5-hydroxy-6-metoxy-1,4-benzoquinol methylase
MLRLAARVILTKSTIPLEALFEQFVDWRDERVLAVSFIKFPDEPVLDVGTGSCACIANSLAKGGHNVVASDNDRRAIRNAHRFVAGNTHRSRIKLLHDDITASRLKTASYLNIVCFNVLHHIANLAGALAELHRILAPEGRLIISEYDEDNTGYLRKLESEVDRCFARVTTYVRPQERLLLVCEKSSAGKRAPQGMNMRTGKRLAWLGSNPSEMGF